MREPQFVRVPLHPPPNARWTDVDQPTASRVVIYAPYLSSSVRRSITWSLVDDPERPLRLYCVVIYTVTSRILQQVHPKRFHWLVMGKSCSLCELRHRQFVGGPMRSLTTCVHNLLHQRIWAKRGTGSILETLDFMAQNNIPGIKLVFVNLHQKQLFLTNF